MLKKSNKNGGCRRGFVTKEREKYFKKITAIFDHRNAHCNHPLYYALRIKDLSLWR